MVLPTRGRFMWDLGHFPGSDHSLEDCSICYEHQQNPYKCSCGHTFCYECIRHWLTTSNTCPNCRQILFTDDGDVWSVVFELVEAPQDYGIAEYTSTMNALHDAVVNHQQDSLATLLQLNGLLLAAAQIMRSDPALRAGMQENIAQTLTFINSTMIGVEKILMQKIMMRLIQGAHEFDPWSNLSERSPIEGLSGVNTAASSDMSQEPLAIFTLTRLAEASPYSTFVAMDTGELASHDNFPATSTTPAQDVPVFTEEEILPPPAVSAVSVLDEVTSRTADREAVEGEEAARASLGKSGSKHGRFGRWVRSRKGSFRRIFSRS